MMTRRVFLITMVIVVLLYAASPQILGMIRSGSSEYYTGLHSVAATDITVYYAYMNQAAHGAFAFRDVFTTESDAPAIVNPLWLLIGRLQGLLHLPVEWAFHLARLGSGVLLVLFLWRFLGRFFSEEFERRTALFGLLFTSGLGVLTIIFAPQYTIDLYDQPMDLWVSEGSVLLSILHSAHFVVGTLLLVAGFALVIRALEQNRARAALYAGLLFLVLFSFHPFHVPTVGLVLLVTAVAEFLLGHRSFKKLWLLALPLLVSAPAIIYHVAILFLDSIIRGRADQNINLIPPLFPTLMSYGFLLPLALIGAGKWLQHREIRYRFIVWWGIAHFSVLFAPIFFNRRLSQGLDIPLTILAVAGFFVLVRWWRTQSAWRKKTLHPAVWVPLVVVFFSLSPLYALARDLSIIADKDGEYAMLFYRPNSERAAYRAFEELSGPEDPFLAGPITGNFFAAYTGRQAYVGHGVETLDFMRKFAQVGTFFSESSPEERADFLEQEHLRWIILRKGEFSYTTITEETPGVHEVFVNDAARIYSVDTSGE